MRAMLSGRNLLSPIAETDPFVDTSNEVKVDLKIDDRLAGWWMEFHPVHFDGSRFPTKYDLEKLIWDHAVRLYHEFPGCQRGTFPTSWGIGNDLYGETWAITKSGLFCLSKEFRENDVPAEQTSYSGYKEAIPPGRWIEYQWAMRTVVDFFLFLSRIVQAYRPGEGSRIKIKAGPLDDRKLVSLDWSVRMGYLEPQPCRASFFHYDRVFDTESLQLGWEQIAAEMLKELFDLFPNVDISKDVLLKWVQKLKNRE